MMSEGILLFIEQRDGVLNRTSYEAMVAAQGIAPATGDKISAVVFGRGISNIATEVAGKKLEAVYTVEDDKLAEYTPGGYVAALKQVIEQLIAATGDLQPHLSSSRFRAKACRRSGQDLCDRLRGLSR